MAKKPVIAHQERAHAEYGASKSKIWLNCAGAIQLAKKAPPPAPSPYADEGTRAHEVLEAILLDPSRETIKRLRLEYVEPLGAREYIGRPKYDEEMIAHGIATAEYIGGRLKNYPGAELRTESRVDASHFTKPGQFGTTDCAIVQLFGRLIVQDYKYGAGVAEDPENNTQGIYYALALAKEYDYNFAEVEIEIIQPRCQHAKGPRRSWIVPMGELIKWEETFRKGVVEAEKPNAPLKSGEHCRWCPAKVICPEISSNAMKRAQLVFKPGPGTEKTAWSNTPHTVDLPSKLLIADSLERWIKSVRDYAESQLHAGRPVPGFKLVASQARRKWANEGRARKALVKALGQNVLEPLTLKSPNQIQEFFGIGAAKLLAAHVVKVSSGFTMVEEADPRPAVNPAKEAFKNVATFNPALTAVTEKYLTPIRPLIDPHTLKPYAKGKK